VSWLLECDQRSPHGFNLSRYCNQTVDARLKHAAASFDRATRIADYDAIQRQVVSDLPFYFICQISEVDVIPMSLQGYQRPMLSPFNSVASWK
jgi:ABC-type transport system substrate-binding protein